MNNRRRLIILGGLILIFMPFLTWLISANRHLESQTSEFSNKLLPVLRDHLVSTGQFDSFRFTLGRVASRHVSVKEPSHPEIDLDPNVIIIDGAGYYMVMSDEPTTSPVLCVLYNKKKGWILKLILAPWTEWN